MARAIQILRDTAAAFIGRIPRVGMPFFCTDTKEFAVGDGTSTAAAILDAQNDGGDYDSATLSSTGTTTPSIAGKARSYDLLLQLGAGAGAYTRKVVLAATNRRDRDKVVARIEIAASGNPTLEIRDATAAGTLLLTQPGSADGAQVWVATLIYRSSTGAWTVRSLVSSQL